MTSIHQMMKQAPRRHSISVLVVAAVGAAHIGVVCNSGDGQESFPTSPAEDQQLVEDVPRPKPWITIARETTYVTQPVDEDGYVDYLAALNEAASVGVTVDNNAGILLVRAMGLATLQGDNRERFFKMLGVELLPETGEYFEQFPDPSQKADSKFDNALVAPWSAGDFPLLAQWLKENQKPLELVIDATRRSHCYFPLVKTAEGEKFYDLPLPAVEASREIARALAARAMLKLNDGKVVEAQQDLLACHRLGRLVGRTPSLIAGLVGVAIEYNATAADAALLEHGKLSAADALAYREELGKLPPLPDMAHHFDHWERLMFLGTVTDMTRGQQIELAEANGPPGTPEFEALADRMTATWDETLRTANREWDRWVEAARRPTVSDRQKQIEILDAEFRPLNKMKLGEGDRFQGKAPREAGQTLGRKLIATLLPAFDTAAFAEDRTRTREHLGQLGFALAAYRAENGSYPATLDALVPKYCNEVPEDRFAMKPLHYVRQDDGYILYSVGKNTVDDDGRTPGSQPSGDDIVLQIPRKVPIPRIHKMIGRCLMQLAAVLFTMAAIGGLTMAGIRLKGTPRPPTWLALGHGAFAAAGLAVLIYTAATQVVPTLGLVSLGLFVLAALGGATLFVAFHLKEKPLPVPFVLGHGAIALTALVLLMLTIYQSPLR